MLAIIGVRYLGSILFGVSPFDFTVFANSNSDIGIHPIHRGAVAGIIGGHGSIQSTLLVIARLRYRDRRESRASKFRVAINMEYGTHMMIWILLPDR
jgi:hypothetical protein